MQMCGLDARWSGRNNGRHHRRVRGRTDRTSEVRCEGLAVLDRGEGSACACAWGAMRDGSA
jgi:hypothetical protein